MKATDRANQLLATKQFREKLGDKYVLSTEDRNNINRFFLTHKYVNERDNFWRYAEWLSQGKSNWEELNAELKKFSRMSVEYFSILYGHVVGTQKIEDHRKRAKYILKNNKEYWLARGYSHEDAVNKVAEVQQINSTFSPASKKGATDFSIRCAEYWIKKGKTHEEASSIISDLQARGLRHFVQKYGNIVGKQKYQEMLDKRSNTWKAKTTEELKLHSIKTIPKTHNPFGLEQQAIDMFIEQNCLQKYSLIYGAPADQFLVDIPYTGIRRYDLAVIDTGKLKIIFEFHGPGHINFSDYSPDMEHMQVTSQGRPLLHLGTYGKTCYNDLVKKLYIETNFPDVQYCVGWTENLLIKKDLKIDNIICRRHEDVPEWFIFPRENPATT